VGGIVVVVAATSAVAVTDAVVVAVVVSVVVSEVELELCVEVAGTATSNAASTRMRSTPCMAAALIRTCDMRAVPSTVDRYACVMAGRVVQVRLRYGRARSGNPREQI